MLTCVSVCARFQLTLLYPNTSQIDDIYCGEYPNGNSESAPTFLNEHDPTGCTCLNLIDIARNLRTSKRPEDRRVAPEYSDLNGLVLLNGQEEFGSKYDPDHEYKHWAVEQCLGESPTGDMSYRSELIVYGEMDCRSDQIPWLAYTCERGGCGS